MPTAVSSSTCRYRVSEAIVARVIAEEMVLLDLNSGIYYSLNGAGAFIWQQIEAGQRADEAVQAVTETYDVPHEVATADVLAFLEALVTPGLLVAR